MYSNPGIQVRSLNKDFGAVSHTEFSFVCSAGWDGRCLSIWINFYNFCKIWDKNKIPYYYILINFLLAPGVPTVPKQTDDKPVKLLAKYSYKGNPDRPGGFDELTVTQGEKLEFCRAHPKNPHWWEAKNTNGNVGFIPATYMMVCSWVFNLRPGELVWSKNKRGEGRPHPWICQGMMGRKKGERAFSPLPSTPFTPTFVNN